MSVDRPVPPDVLAAIAAAVELAWLPPPPADCSLPHPPVAWRFSGRWWHLPVTARRGRP
ncbi:MAG: hypothetical protein M0Z87_04225 [Actinomycetota bacterium]|nr:hypothetical protein [Actinomycetota bacterium]